MHYEKLTRPGHFTLRDRCHIVAVSGEESRRRTNRSCSHVGVWIELSCALLYYVSGVSCVFLRKCIPSFHRCANSACPIQLAATLPCEAGQSEAGQSKAGQSKAKRLTGCLPLHYLAWPLKNIEAWCSEFGRLSRALLLTISLYRESQHCPTQQV